MPNFFNSINILFSVLGFADKGFYYFLPIIPIILLRQTFKNIDKQVF